MPVIDYYFTSASPYAYLGHEEIRSVAGRHNATLRPLAVDVTALWTASGAVPMSKRSQSLQDYRVIDLKRIAERRNVPLVARPKFFPVDPAFADLVTIALVTMEKNPLDFMAKVLSGVWVRDEDIGDRVQIEAYLAELGFPAEEVVALAESPDSAAQRKANSDAAIAAGLPGVPGYVLSGEPFFGQDRIDDLEHALDSGRGPFHAD